MFDHEFKSALQGHFTDGLAIVVGSGLSCAEGLSGMGALADHLCNMLPRILDGESLQEWEELSSAVSDKGLEPALMVHEPSEALGSAINTTIIELLGPEEKAITADVITGRKTLRFSRLVPHLLTHRSGLPILTTNYDRLIELACEAAGLHVDTMFDGAFLGRAAPEEARKNQLRYTGIHSRSVRKEWRKHARVFKPHGSMDWYEANGRPVRFVGDLPLPRLIVTPGRGKLRRGYDAPFDEHRDTMNKLIEQAARLLVIGYGFNDGHLETRIATRIRSGAPALILTRELSLAAQSLAERNSAVVAIERACDDTSRVYYRRAIHEIRIPNLWDLNGFISEVLEP